MNTVFNFKAYLLEYQNLINYVGLQKVMQCYI